MAKKTKLFKFMFYADDWRASARVSELSLSERGLLFELLCASFMADDCGLPTEEKKLAQLARVDTEEFQTVWPNVKQFFCKKKDRLYNEKMVEEKKRALKTYDRCVSNGKKGGRPSEGNLKTHGLSQTESRDNPQAKQPEPETETELDLEIDTPERHSVEPEPIGNILAGDFTYIKNDIPIRIKKLIPQKDWERSGHWFEDMATKLDSVCDLSGILGYMEDCRNPVTRRAKDLGELKNPGGYLRKKFISIAKENGVQILSDSQARNNYES